MRRVGTITIMIDLALLPRLLAWMSPSFPTGGFAYSHGLEWAIDAGDVTDAATLETWLTDTLRHGGGWSDAVLLRLAWRGFPDIGPVASLGRAVAVARERRAETVNQGNAFALAAAAWSAPVLPADTPYPVAVGAIASAQAIPEDAVAVAYLQVFTGNLISAAVRLVPLGQTAGLRVMAALEPVILAVADASRGATLDDIGGCAFRSDLAAMRHETQYTRLFRS